MRLSFFLQNSGGGVGIIQTVGVRKPSGIPKNGHPIHPTKTPTKKLTQIFQDLEGEIALLTATAKFEYATNKITENDLKLKLAYIEDTKKLAAILKTRIARLREAIN
jgi:hypothetical protein